ncbi:NAD(P)-binding protein [Lophiostoma macrostomum CBS 122681]|uniref:NAD(P)-binding protein n=1 Tax=Lophiostoma macrostomum CBS 122681 TaxID=1314788 RepID=A0A6A6SW16_9PLEO|nr:NAD(P)-binding protein [Lophiostoma macrostomum CBS 122681]
MASTPRHVLITGGSRGIGLAIAQLFASHSYRCTLISRSAETLQTAVASLPSSRGVLKHSYIAGDISSARFWDGKIDGTARVDVLVNCAGITQSSLFTRTSSEEIERIVDTNLTGMLWGTRYLLRRRNLTRGSVIVNVASLLGVKGGFGAVAYAASKAGVLGFTRALAEELGQPGIRVNAIVPGYISTDMTAEMADSQDLLRKIPVGRFGKPEEVADAAMFLVRNEYANNCVLNLDGGLSAT